MKRTALFLALLFSLSQVLQAQTPLITNTWQLSSPHTDNYEGSDIGALTDGDNKTYWHSDWHNEVIADYHYVEVEIMNEPVVGLFQLYMHRRDCLNDHPIEMIVTGSSDHETWESLATINLPYKGFTGAYSNIFVVSSPVKYFRFTATDCAGGFRKIWHAAELQLYQLSEQYEFDSSLKGVKINEVQVANIDQYIDNSYNYGGWIELYNPSSTSHYLDGAVVRHTDADNVVEEYTLNINHGLLSSGGYMCLWFDHNSADGVFGDKAHLQIPFKLDPEGGSIELLNYEGDVIDAVDYPEAIARCSYARTTDAGDAWGWTAYATPAQSNEGVPFATQRLEAPMVSAESTLFAEGEEISFTVDIPAGTRLMYTTDGSAPTVNHGTESYDGEFSTSETTVYRFVLVADDKLPSAVVTRTFIKDVHNLEIPVLCLSTHPNNLYSNEIGVYTRGTNGVSGNGQGSACNWNMDWERPANVEYLVKGDDGYSPVINQEVEFEIAGGWTRAYGGDGDWEMKSSFRLKSGKLFEGKNSFDYPFFADSKPYNKYKTLLVRNGGNDTYGRIFDPALQEIVRRSGFYVDCQAWQPCHVFFNGKYLGMLNLRDNNNRNFAESEYGVDKDDTDQFELNSTLGYEQKSGTRDAFWQWLLLTKDLAADPTNENIWQQICELVDIDEFCNYMATECYIGSNDWLTNSNNLKGFRSRVDDGKFHFVLFDADQAFTTENMLSQIYGLTRRNDSRYADNGGVSYVAELLVNMLTYEPFRKQFVNAFSIVDGSIFEPDRSLAIIDEMEAYVSPALALEGNQSSLYSSANRLRNSISSDSRRSNCKYYMKNILGLPHECQVTMKSNIPEARLLLDGQDIPTRKFDGTIYGPAVISAKAPAGYVFKGWQVGDVETQLADTLISLKAPWQYYDRGSLDDRDWKSGDNAIVWVEDYAPFGYGNIGIDTNVAGYNTELSYGDASNKRPTYYFSTFFRLSEQPTYADTYVVDYYVDDGAIIYVNGVEVDRHLMKDGPASYDDYSTGYDSKSPYHGTIAIPSELLYDDYNVIAAEVHNNSATSSDIFFTAQLTKRVGESSTYLIDGENFVIDESKNGASLTLTAIYDKVSTPTQALERGASPVRINEVGAANDIYINDYYKRKDWVELYNTTDQPIDVSGMYLSDKRTKPQKYQISAEGTEANTIIEPYGKLIVWCDEEDPINQLHTNFKLSNSDGSYVTLQAADGTWSDELVYYEQNRWQTYGRYPDGGQLSYLMDRPTIAQPNVLSPYVLASDDIEQWTDKLMAITLAMQPGWNWVSHNLASGVDRSRFTGYAQHLMGKSSEYLYNLSTGKWSGTLSTIAPATGYKMQFATATEITLRGNLYDAATPVTVVNGWNWVGFPLYNATALEAALANYTPTEGDAIVGINGFATYEQGSWEGSLTELVPGQAYLLKSGGAQEFCWNSLSKPEHNVSARRYALPAEDITVASPWSADIHAYPHVTSIIATISDDTRDLFPTRCVLAAFCGNECRGVAELVDGLFFLNAHGMGGETITFKVVDNIGQEYVTQQSLSLTSETIVGTRQQPLVLSVSDVSTSIWSASAAEVVSVAYYTLSGVRIGGPIPGAYIKRTIYADGHTHAEKVVE